MVLKIVLIAVGSAFGGVGRYAIASFVQPTAGGSFPVGTLTVNVLGCFVIGLCAAAFSGPFMIRDEYKAALMIGVLGAFTTFSTFGLETLMLAGANQLGLAVVNILLSNLLGLTGVWVGYRLVQHLYGV